MYKEKFIVKVQEKQWQLTQFLLTLGLLALLDCEDITELEAPAPEITTEGTAFEVDATTLVIRPPETDNIRALHSSTCPE